MVLAVLHTSFNQDYGCFACGTTNGFRVYNCDPFKETFSRNLNSGVAIVEMLFRCNIQALVGDGTSEAYPRHTVKMWDDHKRQCIGELNFRGEVRAVRLRRDRIVVVMEHKVLVYNFADLKLLHQIDTLANPRGLIAISSAADSTVLVCPGLHTGQVRIELYDRKQTKFISAHNTALACIALSMDGKRCATASDKGTLIRVWNTEDGSLLQELRRGSEPATIYSIALSKHCEWLAVTSDKPTVHVFVLSDTVATGREALASPGSKAANHAATTPAAAAAGGAGLQPAPSGGLPGSPDHGDSAAAAGALQQQQRQNPTSMFNMVKGYVPIPLPIPKYFNSQWSFAQYKLPDEDPGRAIVGFANIEAHTLIVVTQGGRYHKVTFDPVKGGACTQRAYGMYLAPHPDDD